MRHLSKVFFLSLMAAGLFACSNEDDPAVDNNSLNAEKVYMQFKLEVPSSNSRSATDETGTPSDADPDFEVGTDSENTISNVQLVLVDNESNAIIAKSTVDKDSIDKAGKDMYIVSFKSSDLLAKAQVGSKTPIKVIAYCNTTTTLKDQLTLDEVCNTPENTWVTDNFWMTNANDENFNDTFLPSQAELAEHNSSGNPYFIGGIAVERVAARFDIAKNVTFPMQVEGKEEMKIVLTDVAMFNIKKNVNYLRRVSADGSNPKGIEGMFGKETPSNYVVDATGDNLSATDVSQLEWKSIGAITQTDNWTGNNGEPEYYPWRYGVENAFAASESQVENKATGIAFKGKLVPGTACSADLKATLEAGTAPIYVFNDILYGDWTRVKNAANEGFVNGTDGNKFKANPVLKAAYEAAENLKTGGKTEVEAAKAAGFKVFEPKEKVYNVYYNYYNKHNDNENPKVSGPMEYAVVRNNVYKLKVSKISKYGSPEWEKPGEEEIKKDEIYFKVTVKILPWTVRVNNIEF